MPLCIKNILLDIGCGWGEMIAVKKYKVKALGVTLSQKQMEKTNKRIKEKGLEEFAEVQLID